VPARAAHHLISHRLPARGPQPPSLHLQAAKQQPTAAAATNGSTPESVQALADAALIAPSEDAAPAMALDHEESTAAGDSDDLGSEGEEERFDRGWGTYSPMAAAIEAGRKVSRLYVHIREGWHWLNSLLQPLCERGCESRQRCVTFLHSCVASYGWRAQYLLLMQCAAQAPLLTAAHTSPSCCVTDAQARVAVSQASIDELAAEINAETSEEPKTPDEVQQHPHCAAAGIGESLDVIVPSKPCVKPGGSCR